MCISVLPECTSVHHMCVVPEEDRRGRWILWDWSTVVSCHVNAGDETTVLQGSQRSELRTRFAVCATTPFRVFSPLLFSWALNPRLCTCSVSVLTWSCAPSLSFLEDFNLKTNILPQKTNAHLYRLERSVTLLGNYESQTAFRGQGTNEPAR